MNSKKPYLVVVLIQTIFCGYFLLSKVAFDRGLNTFVFTVYRQAAATLFLLPFSLIFEWKNAPPLSFITLCKIFLFSLFGITLSLNMYGIGLNYATPTLAAAGSNCVPAITFFFALLLREETVKIGTIPGNAKVAGIVACMGGAATLAFYKGPQLRPLFHLFKIKGHQAHGTNGKTWIKGCFLLLTSNSLYALSLVLQVRLIKTYPAKLLLTNLLCFTSAIQSFAIAIAVERDSKEWKLDWNVKLLAVAYAGFVVMGAAYYLQTWIIEKKGSVFMAMSSPLGLIITIFCSSFFLGDITYLGSILGGILLVGGLYSVLWGKSKEQMLNNKNNMKSTAEKELVIRVEQINGS